MFMDLVYLLYVSKSTLPPSDAEAAVEGILRVARARNAQLDVTGALLFTQHRFAQLLEGPHAAVQELMTRIRSDARHTDIVVVAQGPIEQRQFARWAMAYSGPSIFVARTVARALRNTGSPQGASDLVKFMVEFSGERA